jgi:response regulator of citrate/malate metabolism
MKPHDVIVAQSDCVVAEHLAAKLHPYFKSVSVARNVDEIKHIIHRQGADVVVIDLCLAGIRDVRHLTEEFHGIGFICTHRVPDEEMWRETLEAGAVDCCANDDVLEIVRATRTAGRTHAAAA